MPSLREEPRMDCRVIQNNTKKLLDTTYTMLVKLEYIIRSKTGKERESIKRSLDLSFKLDKEEPSLKYDKANLSSSGMKLFIEFDKDKISFTKKKDGAYVNVWNSYVSYSISELTRIVSIIDGIISKNYSIPEEVIKNAPKRNNELGSLINIVDGDRVRMISANPINMQSVNIRNISELAEKAINACSKMELPIRINRSTTITRYGKTFVDFTFRKVEYKLCLRDGLIIADGIVDTFGICAAAIMTDGVRNLRRVLTMEATLDEIRRKAEESSSQVLDSKKV